MNNMKLFTENQKFGELCLENKQAVLKLDKCLTDEGYIFNGNWRSDSSPGGYNSSFELISDISGRKNLVTLRSMKNWLKVEVYWGFSKDIPSGKKPKQYYKVGYKQEVPQELINEIKEFYRFLVNKDTK